MRPRVLGPRHPVEVERLRRSPSPCCSSSIEPGPPAADRGRRPAGLLEDERALDRAPPRAHGLHRRAARDAGRLAIVGEARLIGLFTSKAYMEPASKTPLLHHKLEQMLTGRGSDPRGRTTTRPRSTLFESFPKDELFAASTEELRRLVSGLLQLQKQQGIRVLVRRDLYGRSVSVVVALAARPVQRGRCARACRRCSWSGSHGSTVDYHLSLGETGVRADLLHRARRSRVQIPDVPYEELEAEVERLARTWDDDLQHALIDRVGSPGHRRCAAEVAGRASPTTTGRTPTGASSSATCCALEALESVRGGLRRRARQRASAGERLTRVTLYKTGGKIDLSAFMPILEALGSARRRGGPDRAPAATARSTSTISACWIRAERVLDLAESADRVAETIVGRVARRDRVRLAEPARRQRRPHLAPGRDPARVPQVPPARGAALHRGVSERRARGEPEIAAKLVRLFEARFDPARAAHRGADRRGPPRHPAATCAGRPRSTRTGSSAPCSARSTPPSARTPILPERQSCAFKLRSAERSRTCPSRYPLYEIFVYSPEMEAIHLRGGMVARGGIRWSDRKEDYRTEVLGLMKAQKVKNAVIVPDGSKGGFVLKRTPTHRRRPATARSSSSTSRSCAGCSTSPTTSIGRSVVHPEGVRVLDDDDPYLVVAADKGTATFTDTANGVAAEYGFWLGDAFASGGWPATTTRSFGHHGARRVGVGEAPLPRDGHRHHGRHPSRWWGSATCRATCSATGCCCRRRIRARRAPSIIGTSSSTPTRTSPSVSSERRRLFDLPGSSWADYDRRRCRQAGGDLRPEGEEHHAVAAGRAALGIADDVPAEMHAQRGDPARSSRRRSISCGTAASART